MTTKGVNSFRKPITLPKTLGEVFETLPKSEVTLRRRGYRHFQWILLNDLGAACIYRVVNYGNKEIVLGEVTYYKGRLLVAHGYKETSSK
jgi:hypothetical protein